MDYQIIPPKPPSNKEKVLSTVSYGLAIYGCGGSYLLSKIPPVSNSYSQYGLLMFVALITILGSFVLALFGLIAVRQMKDARIREADRLNQENLQQIALAQEQERIRSAQEQEKKQMVHLALDRASTTELAETAARIFTRRSATVEIEVKAGGLSILRIKYKGKFWIAIVQKTVQDIGTSDVKKLYEYVVNEKAEQGFYFSTENFTRQASEWVKGRPLKLINQDVFVDMILGK